MVYKNENQITNIIMSYKIHPRSQDKTKKCYITIHYKDIEQLFNMTIDNACKHLGISKTSLKKICRHFNILKWPYRNFNKNIIKPAIPIKKQNEISYVKEPAIPIKKQNDLKYIKDQEIHNDLSFLTGLNINENPYTLEKILFDFY
jgi:hypothetical protein